MLFVQQYKTEDWTDKKDENKKNKKLFPSQQRKTTKKYWECCRNYLKKKN